MTLGAFIFCCMILLLLWLYQRGEDRKNRIIGLIMSRPVNITDISDRPSTLLGKTTKFFEKHLSMFFPSSFEMQKMSQLITRANMDKVTPEELFTIRIILSAALTVLTFLVFRLSRLDWPVLILITTASGYLGFLLPRLIVSSRAESRQRQAGKEILDYIELLSTATEAGLTIHDGIKRVADYSPGVLAEEFDKVWADINSGKSRAEAFRLLAQRLDVEDITIFIDDIIHSERQGTPIARVMKRQANRIRENAKIKAVERAQKAAGKMLIPTIGLILLPMLALAMAPLFITLANSFIY